MRFKSIRFEKHLKSMAQRNDNQNFQFVSVSFIVLFTIFPLKLLCVSFLVFDIRPAKIYDTIRLKSVYLLF